MLNPGDARLTNTSVLVDEQDASGELIPDKTMMRLAEILQQSSQDPLDGRFHIYNLFSLQNTSSKDAVKEDAWLQEAFIKNVEIINQFRVEQHPWVLLAWSTERGAALQKLKAQWLLAIQEINIKVFGIKAKGKHMFYHPYQRIEAHRERYFQQIVHQLRSNNNIFI